MLRGAPGLAVPDAWARTDAARAEFNQNEDKARKRGGLAATPPIVRHHSEPQGGALPVGPTKIWANLLGYLHEVTSVKPKLHFGDPDLSMIHDRTGSVTQVSVTSSDRYTRNNKQVSGAIEATSEVSID